MAVRNCKKNIRFCPPTWTTPYIKRTNLALIVVLQHHHAPLRNWVAQDPLKKIYVVCPITNWVVPIQVLLEGFGIYVGCWVFVGKVEHFGHLAEPFFFVLKVCYDSYGLSQTWWFYGSSKSRIPNIEERYRLFSGRC